MKLTKMILWFLIGLGCSIGLLTLIWERLSYLISVSIGICLAAIPLQIILYIQTRTKKERPIFSIFLIMFIICFIFLYTIGRDTSDFIRCLALAAWGTSYAATISLIIDKPLDFYKKL
jgi:lipoprotein